MDCYPAVPSVVIIDNRPLLSLNFRQRDMMSQLTELVDDYYKSYDYRNLRDETKKQYQYFINVMLNTEVDGQSLSTFDYTSLPTRVAKVAYNQWCEKGYSYG